MSTATAHTSRAIEPNAIYSVRQAAEITPVSAFTLRKYLRLGVLKGKGRPYRIRGSELLKLA
jgi:predicted transcriptional regulator of viral defense system